VQNCLYFTIFAKGLFSLIEKTEPTLAFVPVAGHPKGQKPAPEAVLFPVVFKQDSGAMIHFLKDFFEFTPRFLAQVKAGFPFP
jgi:hypothetical protein